MTKLDGDASITRETAAQERTRPIVIVLHPRYLTVRLKGTREAYNLDYELLLALGRRRQFEIDHRKAVPARRKK
jgi:hypothetical protein